MKATHLLNIVLAAGLLLVCGKFAMAEGGDNNCNSSKIVEETLRPVDPQTIIINNILTRASVRKFQSRPVEEGKIETLLRAGMAAPTAVDKRPWHFVAITDRAVLDEMAGSNRNGGMLRQAPLAIVVCGDMNKALNGVAREYWVQDTSAATENILLAAHGLGLGAVWTGVYPIQERCDELRKVLNMPEHLIPLCTIIIGYPDGNVTPKDKWDPANVTYNKF